MGVGNIFPPADHGLQSKSNMPWLVLLIAYFGSWPEWINLFTASCATNKNVHWRFLTDCGVPDNCPSNVEIRTTSFDDYKNLVSERLGFSFQHASAYKASEIRPALGYIYEKEIKEFEFFGYADIDVIWGDIDRFYGPLRGSYDLITTHEHRTAGHFSIFRNTPQMRGAFLNAPGYPEQLQQPGLTTFDEWAFAKVFENASSWRTGPPPRSLFKEQYSTIFSPRGWHDGTQNWPKEWYWRDGHLTNDRDGAREFLYLHFMRWRTLRYRPPLRHETEGAWLQLKRTVSVDWRDAARNGFTIGAEGFQPLRQSPPY
jgi:hypothetical protein